MRVSSGEAFIQRDLGGLSGNCLWEPILGLTEASPLQKGSVLFRFGIEQYLVMSE